MEGGEEFLQFEHPILDSNEIIMEKNNISFEVKKTTIPHEENEDIYDPLISKLFLRKSLRQTIQDAESCGIKITFKRPVTEEDLKRNEEKIYAEYVHNMMSMKMK